MNSGQIRKSKSTERFTVIPNGILEDKALSLKAIGLLCYLLRLPSNWIINKTSLHRHLKDGRDAVLAAFKELQDAGYIETEEIREKGKFVGFNYEVSDFPKKEPLKSPEIAEKPITDKPETEKAETVEPITGFPESDKPESDKPKSGKPKSENPALLNTNSTKDEANKELNEQNHAQAVNGSAGHVNGKLFEDLKPVKTEKAKKENEAAPQKEKSLYCQFIDVYDHWFKKLNDCPPKITAADGSAAKSLIQYFRKDANDRAAKTGEILDEKTESARVVESWTVFLQNWDLLDNFSQARTRIVDINSNLQNLIIQIKAKYGNNNNSKRTSGDPGRKSIRDASHEDIANAINKAFGE
jgi:hypothetical protein